MPALTRMTLIGLGHRPNYLKTGKSIISLYGIWNLDFFRAFDLGICWELIHCRLSHLT